MASLEVSSAQWKAPGAAVGSPTHKYTYSGSQLLATLWSGGSVNYHHPDQLSIRVNSRGDTGAVLGQLGHFPGVYPERSRRRESWYASGIGTKYQFTSYERDTESTLDYAIFRYDNTRLGRFMTPDPLAGSLLDPQSLNRYSYVRNDPINLVDPLGLATELTCYVDGVPVNCAFAFHMMEKGAFVGCPNNVCSGWGEDPGTGETVYARYTCFAGGPCGYYSLPGLAAGCHPFGGMCVTSSAWQGFLAQAFGDKIEAQRRALAQAIVEQSGEKIAFSEALEALSTTGGFLRGGNYNFVIDPEFLATFRQYCSGGRCGGFAYGIHISQTYIHLDTASPSAGFRAALLHFAVDIVGGNVAWWVIPR